MGSQQSRTETPGGARSSLRHGIFPGRVSTALSMPRSRNKTPTPSSIASRADTPEAVEENGRESRRVIVGHEGAPTPYVVPERSASVSTVRKGNIRGIANWWLCTWYWCQRLAQKRYYRALDLFPFSITHTCVSAFIFVAATPSDHPSTASSSSKASIIHACNGPLSGERGNRLGLDMNFI